MAFKTNADAKIATLVEKQAEFGGLTYAQKAILCDELLDALKTLQPELPALGDAAALAQGHGNPSAADADTAWAMEQLLFVQWVTGFLNTFKGTLQSMEKTGTCPEALSTHKRDDGRYVAQVFPREADKFKPNKNWKCELWMKQGEQATQGAMFSKKPRAESFGLVLGAGNAGALAIMDCLHLLFQCNTVVLYKLHPVRAYQEHWARKLFAPLISKGYLDTIKEESGLADSQYLVNHAAVCQIHMTGSTETHDCIVWGPKEGREQRRKEKKPVIDLGKVSVTSELGCVTPYMVCPGSWTEAELKHHALHLAVACTGNNGYFCNSPKVLLLAEGWAQKDAFLAILQGILASLPAVAPYYPGSHKRYQGFEAAYGAEKMMKIKGPGHGSSEQFGEHLPWTLVNVTADPANLEASMNEYAFRNEPFCPILTVCTIKNVTGAREYLEAATTIANKCIWGRLSCSLVVHPETEKAEPQAVDNAIAALEYGAVVINCWSAMSYSMDCGVWGAYAGGSPQLERIECLESGLGFVNNALAFDHVEKAVARCPFIDKDTQVGTGGPLARNTVLALTNLMINPGLKALLKLIFPRLCGCV